MADKNTRRIEESATTSLTNVLWQCPLLEPHIASNDKTPSWDGEVIVYNHQNAKKENIYGTVPVQIKGTSQRIRKTDTTHRFEVADLRNYYNGGGCILFLVSVNPNVTGDYKIYYSSLLVVDLDQILKNESNRKKITIPMKEFPEHDPDEMANVFMSFISNRPRQMQFIGKSIKPFSQLEEEGVNIDKYTFTVVGPRLSQNTIGEFVTSHDIYLYAKPKGLDVDISVEKIQNLFMSKSVFGSVKIKDKTYFDSYKVVYHKLDKIIRIGTGISIKIDSEREKVTIHIDPAAKLSEFIEDASFFVELLEQQEVTLNGGRLIFSTFDPNEMDIEGRKANLKYYIELQKMLQQLGVKEELEVLKLTEQDHINLRNFVNAALHGKEIGFPDAEDSVIYGGFNIGNLCIWIRGHRQPDGYYLIENFFQHFDLAMFDSSDKKMNSPIPVSGAVLLNKEAFIHCSNMDFDFIVQDIAASEISKPAMDRYNFLLLDMISAYDEQAIPSKELLTMAEKIYIWIRNYPDYISKEIILINLAQIHYRQNKLTNKEKINLAKLTDEAHENFIRCGAYILLDEFEEAERCFSKMSSGEQSEFEKYPICNLWTREGGEGI